MFQLFHSTLLDSDRAARGRLLFFSDRTAPRRRRLSRRAVSGRSLFAKKKEKLKKGENIFFFQGLFQLFPFNSVGGRPHAAGSFAAPKRKTHISFLGQVTAFWTAPQVFSCLDMFYCSKHSHFTWVRPTAAFFSRSATDWIHIITYPVSTSTYI